MGSAGPHIHFAHGGSADFRGKNGTFYAYPHPACAARTVDTSFLLPVEPLWTELLYGGVVGAARFIRPRYGVSSIADQLGFDVFDLEPSDAPGAAAVRIESKRNVWTEWWQTASASTSSSPRFLCAPTGGSLT